MLTRDERARLLAIAHGAIGARLGGKAPPRLDAVEGRLAQPGAAFVTLRLAGQLRGCIGSIVPSVPLAEAVAHAAAASATADPRFDPLEAAELDRLELEISVLGVLEAIEGPEEIELGRHGLVVEHGAARGLLLPQVAVEWRWSREVFLAETCRKAGLQPDAWLAGARLFRFEAAVFGEA
jgi:AmmeMemoRadiSam system protein A